MNKSLLLATLIAAAALAACGKKEEAAVPAEAPGLGGVGVVGLRAVLVLEFGDGAGGDQEQGEAVWLHGSEGREGHARYPAAPSGQPGGGGRIAVASPFRARHDLSQRAERCTSPARVPTSVPHTFSPTSRVLPATTRWPR